LERNSVGTPTGKYKTFSSDNSYKIWEFFNKNSHFNSKSSKKTKRTSSKRADSFIKNDMDAFCDKIKSKKRPKFDDGEKV